MADETRRPDAPDLAPEKTIVLDKPLSLGEISYQSLSLREPTAGELDDVSAKTGIGWTIALVHLVSGWPLQVVRKIPARPLNEAAEYLVPFCGAVRPTALDG